MVAAVAVLALVCLSPHAIHDSETPLIEGNLEAKLPTIWTDGKAQSGRSSGMEKIERREGEDQRWRKKKEKRCRCAKK